ncbi:MAG: UbiX family flavin prenyltransferase [Armatimonadetes bacterium]|nr:UbiX family flavin prenyltransferase [Armatimonadota bacterium]
MLPYIVAISGASGVIYAKYLIDFLIRNNSLVYLLISKNAHKIIKEELNFSFLNLKLKNLFYEDYLNWGSPLASGSFKSKGMVIVPCSMSTLACISNGTSNNLIHRRADISLKEKEKLILVPRETPLNLIHLENMLKLSKAGAEILPAMPAFYRRPETIQDLINFITGRILERLGIKHKLYPPYSGAKDVEKNRKKS